MPGYPGLPGHQGLPGIQGETGLHGMRGETSFYLKYFHFILNIFIFISNSGYPGPKGEIKKPSYDGSSKKIEKKPIFSKRPIKRKPTKPFSIEIPFLLPNMFKKMRVKRHRKPPRNRRRNDRVFNLRNPRMHYRPFRVRPGRRRKNTKQETFSRLKEPVIIRTDFLREPVGRNE